MKKSRFSEQRIVGILREAQGGGGVKAVCARHNVSVQTCCGWKRIVTDLTVQIDILKAVNAKKW